MAYNKFTLNQLRKEYGLQITEQSALFAAAPPAEISDFLRETLRRRAPLGLRSGSEKARSEYIIAPILAEIYELNQDQVSLFSGVEFAVDEQRGLSGFCDFIFTLAPRTPEILAPVTLSILPKRSG